MYKIEKKLIYIIKTDVKINKHVYKTFFTDKLTQNYVMLLMISRFGNTKLLENERG